MLWNWVTESCNRYVFVTSAQTRSVLPNVCPSKIVIVSDRTEFSAAYPCLS